MRARWCVVLFLFISAPFPATNAMALNVMEAAYNKASDEIVFTVAYQGTHPHTFGVAWQECRRLNDGSREILGIVRSTEPRDSAERKFRNTVRISLNDFPCRPATVFIGAPRANNRRAAEVPAAE